MATILMSRDRPRTSARPSSRSSVFVYSAQPPTIAQPTYLWGAVGVETIVDKLVSGKAAPSHIPLELVRVTAKNIGSWARQLRDWGFADVPEEYLRLE